jgi:hypothetical protein
LEKPTHDEVLSQMRADVRELVELLKQPKLPDKVYWLCEDLAMYAGYICVDGDRDHVIKIDGEVFVDDSSSLLPPGSRHVKRSRMTGSYQIDEMEDGSYNVWKDDKLIGSSLSDDTRQWWQQLVSERRRKRLAAGKR